MFKGFLWLVGIPAFCFCFWVAVGAYVKLHDDPSWLKLVTVLIDLVVYLVGPISMFVATDLWHRRFISKFADRLGRMEAILDPHRPSSGLRTDGTDPPLGPNL